MVGNQLRLRDPDNLDFRLEPGFGAEGYGCLSLVGPAQPADASGQGTPPEPGVVLTGAVLEVNGPISVNTTWDAERVLLNADVEIMGDVALTIAPGVRVEASGDHRLLVQGRLWAVGTPENRIVFTTTAGQTQVGWNGIDFHNIPSVNDWSRLEHCLVENAVAQADSMLIQDRLVGGTSRPQCGGALSIINAHRVAIASCEIRNNRADFGAAIYVGYGATPVLAGNLIHNNTAVVRGSALFNVYSYPRLINNTIVGNACLDESSFFLCGAVENFNGKISLVNNIIRQNPSHHYSQTQVVESKDYYTWNNNIEYYLGNSSNLDLPPEWAGVGTHPYQLTPVSPGLDGGIGIIFGDQLAEKDIAGHDRLCGGFLDLGAYEFCGEITTVELPHPQGAGFQLRCTPNPFNPRSVISFTLDQAGQVSLKVLDVRGHFIKTLANGWRATGDHKAQWDGKDQYGQTVSSGVYFCQVMAHGQAESIRMVLLR